MKSSFQDEVIDFLRESIHGKIMLLSQEILPNLVVDAWIPEVNCGIVFHQIGKVYEAQDLETATPDFKIVHLWEDRWIFSREKVESKLNSLMGNTHKIHGRQTKVEKINNAQLMDFLAFNHLNMPFKAKHKFGLFHEDKLVAVMSFSKSREIIRNGIVFNSYELLHFCNKLNTTVVGGFSKLLKQFIKQQNPDDIMTYVDVDWSAGNSWSSLGFELVDRLPPMVFWLDTQTGKRESPDFMQKKHSKSMEDISSLAAKKAFLDAHGFIEVFNSGSYKYLMKRK